MIEFLSILGVAIISLILLFKVSTWSHNMRKKEDRINEIFKDKGYFVFPKDFDKPSMLEKSCYPLKKKGK